VMAAAVSLLEQLNRLENKEGVRYSETIRHHDQRLWWFHQQYVFDHYIVPFVRGVPLSPEPRRPFPRARRIASQVFFRTTSALALAKAAIRRPRVWIYTVDSVDEHGRNRWIPHLHEALAKRGQDFLEIVWSNSGASALRFARQRAHRVAYWQGIRPLLNKPGIQTLRPYQSNAENFLRDVALKVMLPRCAYSARITEQFETLLRTLKPDGVYLMDDSLHAFELAAACKRLGIPTVGIQHGQFSRFTVGLMGYGSSGVRLGFDKYCVWGPWFEQILTSNSTFISDDSVVVAGSFRSPPVPAISTNGNMEPPTVLFVGEHYDSVMQRSEVQPYLQALREAGINVVVKPHPSLSKANAAEPSLGAMMQRADVVVASYSSVIFEAILHEKPVVLFKSSLWNDPHGLAASGIATLAASACEIADAVRHARAPSASELTARRQTVWGDVMQDAGEIALREMDGLMRLHARS
jgi:hypothetical protein